MASPNPRAAWVSRPSTGAPNPTNRPKLVMTHPPPGRGRSRQWLDAVAPAGRTVVELAASRRGSAAAADRSDPHDHAERAPGAGSSLRGWLELTDESGIGPSLSLPALSSAFRPARSRYRRRDTGVQHRG